MRALRASALHLANWFYKLLFSLIICSLVFAAAIVSRHEASPSLERSSLILMCEYARLPPLLTFNIRMFMDVLHISYLSAISVRRCSSHSRMWITQQKKKWEENIGDDDNFKWGRLAQCMPIYILCVRLKFSLLLLALAWNRERSLLLIIGSAIPPLYLNISFEIDFENCSSWLSAGSCFKLFGVCFFSPPPRIIIIIIIVLG